MKPSMPPRRAEPQQTRRQFLRTILLGSSALAANAVLSACVGSSTPANSTPAGSAAATDIPAGAVATSAPATSGTITLSLLYNESEFSDAAVAEFTKSNPNIVVERAKGDSNVTQFKAMLAAGTPPDMFRVSGVEVPAQVGEGYLLDLADYFQASQVIKLDDLAPANSFFVYQGRRYGMVKDWSPDLSLFIDTKAFEQAKVAIPSDKTALRYSDLADLAKQLTKRDGDKLVRMGWSYEAGWFVRTIQVILAQQSQRLYAPDFSAIALTSNPAAIEALRFFFDLSKEGVIWNPADPDPGLGGFVDGKSAITSYGYWFGNMIATASKSPVTDSAMMLPAPTWNGTRLSPSVVGTGAAIAQQSKHPDAAWKLYEYFMAGPPAEQRARTGWGVPGLKSLYPLLPQDTPFNKQRYTVLQSEVAFSDYVIDICPYYADDVFNQSWLNNLEPALKGTIGFDQLIQKIETDVNQAISAGRKRA